jgi:hypothetical protein
VVEDREAASWTPNELFRTEAEQFGRERQSPEYRREEVDYKASLSLAVRHVLSQDALNEPGLATSFAAFIHGTLDFGTKGLVASDLEILRRDPPDQALVNLLGGGPGAFILLGALEAWAKDAGDSGVRAVLEPLLYGQGPIAGRVNNYIAAMQAAFDDLFTRGLLRARSAPRITAQFPAILLAMVDPQSYGLFRPELYQLSAEAFGYQLDGSGTAGERYAKVTGMLRALRDGLGEAGVDTESLLDVHNWLWIRANRGDKSRWTPEDFTAMRTDRSQDRARIALIEGKLRVLGRAVRDQQRQRTGRDFRYKILGLYPPGRTSWRWINASTHEPRFGRQPTAAPQLNVEAHADGLDIFFLFDPTAASNAAQRAVKERLRGRRWDDTVLADPTSEGYRETQEDDRGRYMLRKRFPPEVVEGWPGLGVENVLAEIDRLWPLYEAVTRMDDVPTSEPAKPVVATESVDPLLLEIADALKDKGQAILYGPPGTGKTYNAMRFALWWLTEASGGDGRSVIDDPRRMREAEQQFTRAQRERRVWWVVANPAEWSWSKLFPDRTVEYRYGRLRGNYEQLQPDDLVIGYEANPTKRVVALAKISQTLHTNENNRPVITLRPFARVDHGITWDELLEDPGLANAEPVRFRNQGTLFRLTPTEAELVLARLQERDPSLGELEGLDPTETIGQLTRLTFHPSYTYEDFVEGYRPMPTGSGQLNLELTPGVFLQVCEAARAHPDRPYLLLIDEINRANLPKVFGELITVLELDKRGLDTVLPQSRQPFSIPPNLRILGTMNTADRSIKLLDAAIRRRFAFIELMPDSRPLKNASVGDLELDRFMDALNRRILQREGREKQIGQSYFLDKDGEPFTDEAAFAARFRRDVLPLLQEYAYDDYRELTRYLGKDLVDPDRQRVLLDPSQPTMFVAALANEYREEVEPEPEAEA